MSGTKLDYLCVAVYNGYHGHLTCNYILPTAPSEQHGSYQQQGRQIPVTQADQQPVEGLWEG